MKFLLEGELAIGAIPLEGIVGDTLAAKQASVLALNYENFIKLVEESGAFMVASAPSIIVIPAGSMVVEVAKTEVHGLRWTIYSDLTKKAVAKHLGNLVREAPAYNTEPYTTLLGMATATE